MAKVQDARVRVIMECITCIRESVNNISPGISKYITHKNRYNTPSLLELNKLCRYCNKHTTHREIKK
uniref:Large ribosomal subunit protein bL33c n=1 Tax=Cyperus fuscus TaxID=529431 RepID=A0A6H0EZ88_9POAL|nr:ribosomal protein L33 [Cyperus fuscus]